MAKVYYQYFQCTFMAVSSMKGSNVCKDATAPTCKVLSVADVLEERKIRAEQGAWTPACGGTETPFLTRTGRRLLYCYQATTGKHAYLDCETDLILSDDEASSALAVY